MNYDDERTNRILQISIRAAFIIAVITIIVTAVVTK